MSTGLSPIQPDRRRAGTTMIVVLGISAIIMLAGIALTRMTGQAAFTSRKLHMGAKALAVAEAGVAFGLQRLYTNYNGAVDTVVTNTFGGGWYLLQTSVVGDRLIINSQGHFLRDTRSSVLEIIEDRYRTYDRIMGTNTAIIADRNITLETAALEINGRVHANGDVLHSRGNTVVAGDITAGGTIAVSVSGGQTVTEYAGTIGVPSFLPFDSWYEAATNNGIYYDSSVELGGVDLRPANGVVFVNGDVTIRNQSSLVGTLVATGTITIDNNFEQSQFAPGRPALLAGMNVNLFNRNDYTGTIFAGNDVVSRNRKTVNGSIIALNNVYIEDHMMLNASKFPPTWLPINRDDYLPELLVGGWLQ